MNNRKQRISACMIVKDEEKFLPQCLDSIKNVVDEIVIVDTGSTDKTVDIAQSNGAKVYHHPWENDFSKHRNQSISYASCDWIFIIDADEELVSDSKKIFKRALRDKTIDSIAVQVINPVNKGSDFAIFNSVRIFRNHAGIQYEGIVHNQEVGCSNTKFYPIKILHHGYNLDGSRKQAKFERTSSLLKKQINQDPNNPLPHHYLAVSYMSLGSFDRKYYGKAIEESMTAIKLATEQHVYNHAFLGTYYVAAASYFKLGALDEAEKMCKEALEIFPDHLDSYFLLSKIYDRNENYQEASRCAEHYLVIREGITHHPEKFGKIINNNFSGDWLIKLILAKAEYEKGNKDSSRALFKKLGAEYPENWNLLTAAGYFYFKKSEFHQAARYLEKADKLKREKLFLYMLCECYGQTGRTDEQLKALSDIIETYPDEITNLKQIGMVQFKRSNFRIARFCLGKVIEKGQSSPDLIELLRLADQKVHPEKQIEHFPATDETRFGQQ